MDVQVPRAHSGHAETVLQFTAIDDCTRIRVLKVYDACNQTTAIRFIDDVLRRLPFRVLVIQTDNGAEFQSRLHWHLEEPGHPPRLHPALGPLTSMARWNGPIEWTTKSSISC